MLKLFLARLFMAFLLAINDISWECSTFLRGCSCGTGRPPPGRHGWLAGRTSTTRWREPATASSAAPPTAPSSSHSWPSSSKYADCRLSPVLQYRANGPQFFFAPEIKPFYQISLWRFLHNADLITYSVVSISASVDQNVIHNALLSVWGHSTLGYGQQKVADIVHTIYKQV